MKKKPPPVKKKPSPVNPGAPGGSGNDSDDSAASGDKKPAAVPGKRGGRVGGGRGRGRLPLSSRGRGGGPPIHSNDLSPTGGAGMPGGRTPASVRAQGGRPGGRTPGSARTECRGRGSRVQVTPIRNPNAASLQEASAASLESDDNDAGEEQGSQSGSGGESGDDSSVASLHKITALGDSDHEEEKMAGMSPETKRRAEQTARTRKCQKNQSSVAPLEKLCSVRWLCCVDDTPAAVRKTVVCVDPNPDHPPEEETAKNWTRHDDTLSKLHFNFSGAEFRAGCCHIELAGILARAGAQRFLDNNGFAAEENNDQLIARCQNLVPIHPVEQVIFLPSPLVPRIPCALFCIGSRRMPGLHGAHETPCSLMGQCGAVPSFTSNGFAGADLWPNLHRNTKF